MERTVIIRKKAPNTSDGFIEDSISEYSWYRTRKKRVLEGWVFDRYSDGTKEEQPYMPDPDFQRAPTPSKNKPNYVPEEVKRMRESAKEREEKFSAMETELKQVQEAYDLLKQDSMALTNANLDHQKHIAELKNQLEEFKAKESAAKTSVVDAEKKPAEKKDPLNVNGGKTTAKK